MQSIVQGLVTKYERYGKGPQLLILHGWADDGRSWKVFAGQLGARYEVIVPDLPGFGGTEAPREVWGLQEYADFVAAFIAKAGLKPVAIIGHSNGGAVAMHGIAHGMLKSSKLVLLASAGIRGEGKGRTMAWRLAAKTGKAATLPLPKAIKQRLRRRLYRAAGSDMLVAEHLQETFKRVVSEDIRADARQVHVPALLVYGTNDTAAPPHYGELLATAMPDAKLETVDGAGHFLQLDARDETIRLVREFLK